MNYDLGHQHLGQDKHRLVMLGKRKRQFQYKSKKLSTAKMNIRQAQPYGVGYNPKKVSLRKPPPNAEKKYHDHG